MISHNFNLRGGNLPILHSSLQSSCKLWILHSSNHLANFQSSTFGYENFSKLPILHSSNPLAISQKLLTKTSQIFQSSTFGYAILRKLLTKTSQNFLRKLLKTSNPPLLVMKTSYQNFSKLPILHFSLRKLPIPPVFVTKTSDSSTFGYENLKLPVPPTWKLEKPPILHSSYNFQSSPTWTLMKSWFSATFPPKCVFWTKLGGFPQICPHFFFLTKWTFLQKFNPQKVPKMFIILLFLVLLLLQTFPTSTSYFLNNFYFLSLPNSQICLLFAVTSWTSTITRIFSLFLSLQTQILKWNEMKKNHQKWRILFRLDFLSILEQNPPLLVLFFSKSSTFGYENLKNLYLWEFFF